ncbi:MAG TPA: hypothetical protein VFQ22_13110, partial [Longimicrobiales bacterium]|nr:hypothetical protein [Longimicrobiales bacterium]
MRMLEILAAGPLALALALPSPGRGGYRARYRREVEHRLARLGPLAPPITDADLAALPDPVRRYVR